MARILISTPMLEGCLDALASHELRVGEPGSDTEAEGLLCTPIMPVDADALARMPMLRAISVAGAGTDAIDGEAAAARGITVLTAGGALVETTADAAFGLIIWASRLMSDTERALREGRWQGWRFDQTWGRDVHGATLGLLGFGAIGRAVGRRAGGFGMDVIHHTRHPTGESGWVEALDDLLAASDILSIHVPLTARYPRADRLDASGHDARGGCPGEHGPGRRRRRRGAGRRARVGSAWRGRSGRLRT